ncbi:MAG: carboxypeptidase-like regulatory domain-containing protein, partial [Ginsengibacter sp.]
MNNFPKLLLLVVSTFCLLLLSATSRGQGTITVKGQVVDKATGNPLDEASIQIKGSKAGTTTDANGNYSINASGNAILIFSTVGYENVEMAVNGRTVINISLEVSNKGLSEVVVVGYGTQKRENITGAVGVIHSSSLSDRPTSSPANLLQGLSPGLTVSTQGSYPGASSNIKIRESSTW